MADDGAGGSRFLKLLTSTAQVVAPLSVLSALLFYFGYASSRAQYGYFGLDVDTIGLSTQDYVMRSPQSLLTPMLVLLLAAVGVALLNEVVGQRVGAALARARDGDAVTADHALRRLASGRHAARRLAAVGQGLVVAGLLLLLAYRWVGAWAAYPLVTPLVMALGAALALYAERVARLLSPGRPARRSVVAAVSLLLVADLFWATATFAEWSGRGLAHSTARHLDRLPGVILDTKERLYLTSPGIQETALAASSPEQAFRYRYRNLRLLIQGHDRLFLVPDEWSASDSTLVIPTDGSVRVQYRFPNTPP